MKTLAGERITSTTIRKSVYLDRSKKYTVKSGGIVRVYRHNRWRADVRVVGPDGCSRIRVRFSNRVDAERWLEGKGTVKQ